MSLLDILNTVSEAIRIARPAQAKINAPWVHAWVFCLRVSGAGLTGRGGVLTLLTRLIGRGFYPSVSRFDNPWGVSYIPVLTLGGYRNRVSQGIERAETV